MRRLSHLVVLAAFLFSCGGHWYVLQGIAWVNMIRDYSQFVPVAEAVRMTLSGQYPCSLCKAIAEKKQAENEKACALEKYDKKFFPPDAGVITCAAEGEDQEHAVGSARFPSRPEAPPVPPPRRGLNA